MYPAGVRVVKLHVVRVPVCRVCARSAIAAHPPVRQPEQGPEPGNRSGICTIGPQRMSPPSPRLGDAPHVPARSRTVLVVEEEAGCDGVVAAVLVRSGYRVIVERPGDDMESAAATSPVHVLVVGGSNAAARQPVIEAVRVRHPLARVVVRLAPGEAAPSPAMVEVLGLHGWIATGDEDGLAGMVAAAMAVHERLEHLAVAERLQAELLANVSHEFRTPLAIIIGYIDLMREGTFGSCVPEARATLDRVKGNAAYLLELVEEFLDYSRRDPEHVPHGTVAVAPILRELAESFTLLMREKPVRFAASIDEDLPAVVAEGARLRVIVQNLLTNAAKFTTEGEITLTAAANAERHLVITVADTGPGIPPEARDAIFELFRQLEPRDGRRRGIGLGLALARRFARVFGGDITVASTVGVGTTFTVVLPPARPAARAA